MTLENLLVRHQRRGDVCLEHEGQRQERGH
jgi:hypothetical protein